MTTPESVAGAVMSASPTAAAESSRPWKPALLWLSFLGPFFFASYGFANWAASRRADVGAIVFAWEQHVPFLAWTIVPYWSIDVLYGLSLFVCATRRELDIHARRLLAAQVISVTCFLLVPLRFTFARPATDGLFGAMFDALTGFDKPFNQAPSLHIALLVILWVLYARHVPPGAARWLLHAWFTLIGVSVLTTYQHHFIDIPTGVWVGWLCVWLVPDAGRSLISRVSWTADAGRRTLAFRYGVAAVVLGTIAVVAGGWALWLLWVAAAVGLIAAIYAFLDETAFQKAADGRMSPAAWWLLAPYFAGAWLNSRWWTRRRKGADPVVPGLLLGRMPTRRERRAQGVRAIVDVTAELPCASGNVRYASVPQLDLTVPTVEHLGRVVIAIEAVVDDGPVLVCCALGVSRSASAVAAWLLASGRAASATEAIALVRRARPIVVLHASHVAVLEDFARRSAAVAARPR